MQMQSETNSQNTVPSHVCKWVAERLNELQAEAKLIVDDYWHRLKQGRRGRRQADRGRFGVRLRPRDTGAFSIEWYEMGALGGTKKPIAKRHIAKGRGHRYPLDKMLKGEPEWIVGLVGEVEDSLAEIRKRQALLVAIRDALAAYESEVTGKTVTAAMVVSRHCQGDLDG